jgi:type I site-specific restriction endonuclease
MQYPLRNNNAIEKLEAETQARLEAFIMEELPAIHFLQPDGKPKMEWQMFYGNTWEKAKNAATAAASELYAETMQDKLWREAWDVVHKLPNISNALDAAVATVSRYTALNIMRSTHGAADVVATATSAAFDANLKACYIIAGQVEFEGKEAYTKHANEHWNVWVKGYAVGCEAEGKWYVYAKR